MTDSSVIQEPSSSESTQKDKTSGQMSRIYQANGLGKTENRPVNIWKQQNGYNSKACEITKHQRLSYGEASRHNPVTLAFRGRERRSQVQGQSGLNKQDPSKSKGSECALVIEYLLSMCKLGLILSTEGKKRKAGGKKEKKRTYILCEFI